MDKGILLVGNKCALLSAIETETAKRAERYALALIPNRYAASDSSAADALFPGRLPLEWNPGSPVSARSLIIGAQNRLGRIDEAVFVCSPPSSNCSVADLSLADLEVMAHDQIKGWFLLAKELCAYFMNQGSGILATVYCESGAKDDAGDLLGSAALSAFRSLSRSLLDTSAGGSSIMLSFASGDAGGQAVDDAGFASFISRHLEEGNRKSSGKLFRYGKHSLFK